MLSVVRIYLVTAFVIAAMTTPRFSHGAEGAPEVAGNSGDVDFVQEVLPIFARACFDCHGADQQESSLRLDMRSAVVEGGELFGPSIIPGDAEGSPLVRFIAGTGELEMPPSGAKLTAAEIATLSRWVEQGAVWPGDENVPVTAPLTSRHWSLQPVVAVQPPPRRDPWESNGVDSFILAKLVEANIGPSPRADRRTLMRRLYFDMLGLPPTPEELASFVADQRPDAYEQLVERVLASSRYGERWAQHWLDVVRFAETAGFETNVERPNAWPYRDYVIAAFNDDKPYDQFISEQLAGDAMGETAATGFLVAGAFDQVKSPDVGLTLMQRQDELADMTTVTGTTFLGLTVGCARCHNHKFDPILQKDYFALQAMFAGVNHGESPLIKPDPARGDGLRVIVNAQQNEERFTPREAIAVRFKIDATNNGIEPCIDELEVWSVAAAPAQAQNVALAERGARPSASGTYPGSEKHQLAHLNDGKYGNDWSWISDVHGTGVARIDFAEPAVVDRIVWGRDRLGGFADRLPTIYQVELLGSDGRWVEVANSTTRRPYVDNRQMVYAGTFSQPQQATRRLFRGDPLAPKEEVAPDVLSVLGTLGLAVDAPERARRLALASWIANPDNPLTARVMVNRVWQYHFGVGLVDTPSDFGANGTRPSHPELLDWLAAQFVESGWSVKSLHRLILLSSAYQQSNQPRKDCLAVDADSRLLWRYPPRRLESEAIRDTVLQIAGTLNDEMGGPGWEAFEPNDNYVRVYEPKSQFGPAEWRRMIYMQRVRMRPEAVFGVFDLPDGGQACPKRGNSITAIQALNLFNSDFMMQQAAMMSERLQREVGPAAASQIERAFQLTFNRPPEVDELTAAEALLASHGLGAFCRSMLNANEAMFIP